MASASASGHSSNPSGFLRKEPIDEPTTSALGGGYAAVCCAARSCERFAAGGRGGELQGAQGGRRGGFRRAPNRRGYQSRIRRARQGGGRGQDGRQRAGAH